MKNDPKNLGPASLALTATGKRKRGWAGGQRSEKAEEAKRISHEDRQAFQISKPEPMPADPLTRTLILPGMGVRPNANTVIVTAAEGAKAAAIDDATRPIQAALDAARDRGDVVEIEPSDPAAEGAKAAAIDDATRPIQAALDAARDRGDVVEIQPSDPAAEGAKAAAIDDATRPIEAALDAARALLAAEIEKNKLFILALDQIKAEAQRKAPRQYLSDHLDAIASIASLALDPPQPLPEPKRMTLEEIKAAVLAGKRVFWNNPGYEVIVDRLGEWLVKCTMNGSCIGLTWRDGVTVNGKPEDFYIEGSR